MSALALPASGGDTRHVPPRVSSPEFVGRTAELAVLEAALARAAHGAASAVFVCGESGIGKTRLLRELTVLSLVAEGHTNREIGASLFISEKTASVHVSRILAKLSVRSRVEAATAAHRLGLAASSAPGDGGRG